MPSHQLTKFRASSCLEKSKNELGAVPWMVDTELSPHLPDNRPDALVERPLSGPL
jgi:hypothetical protein